MVTCQCCGERFNPFLLACPTCGDATVMAVDQEWYFKVCAAIARGMTIVREEDTNRILYVIINYAWIAEELRTPVRLLKELLDGVDGEEWRDRVKSYIYPKERQE